MLFDAVDLPSKPYFKTSDLQNYKILSLICFQVSNVWPSVRAAIENCHYFLTSFNYCD